MKIHTPDMETNLAYLWERWKAHVAGPGWVRAERFKEREDRIEPSWNVLGIGILH